MKYTYLTHVFKQESQARVAKNKEQNNIGFVFEQHL
jgi:hypothetical protein